MMKLPKSVLVVIAFAGTLGCSAALASVVRAGGVTDTVSGLHWLRLTDPAHPAAPPRLFLGEIAGSKSGNKTASSGKRTLCVRAGDHLWLRREDQSAAQVSLEATALGSGALGDRVRARIAVTGAVVEMKISGPGSGVLSHEAGKWQ